MGYLYVLTFASGKHYVGQTVRKVADRYKDHACRARAGTRTNALYSAWRKYGAPTMRLFDEVSDDQLSCREIEVIDLLGTLCPNGYNVTPGGEESSMRIAEVAAKSRASNLGKKFSASHLAALRNSHLGKKQSAATRVKCAIASTGRLHTEEARAKMSLLAKGRIITQDVREKISATLMGRKLTEKTRAKLSISQTARWARWRAIREQRAT